MALEMTPTRARLPNRRPSHAETLEVDGQIITACIGFDSATGSPRELFLRAGKEGSLLNSLLDDAAVTISVALQHGVSAEALAKSVGRLPGNGAASLSNAPSTALLPASPIGVALDLITSFEREVG